MRTRALFYLALVTAAVACRPPGASAPVGVTVASTSSAKGGAPVPPARETPEERAARLHRESIIVDTHNDIPSILVATNGDFAKPPVRTHTDLTRLKASGFTAVFFSVYVDRDYAEKPTPAGGGAARRALDLIDITYRTVERHPHDLVLATTAAEIRKAKRDGKVAILMGIEGGHAIENSLAALRDFYRLGVRYMTLTHTNTNEWADSAGFVGPQVVRHHGLSPFGEEVVREMQRIGMLVDISHTSDETFAAVMRIAKAPVIASHSSSRALTEHRRNLTDDMLRALAKNGGVAMVNFWSAFIDPKYLEAMGRFFQKHGPQVEELHARYKDDLPAFRDALERLTADDPLPKTPLSVLADHIDHMIKVAGPDHVGLGTDFDGCDSIPVELDGGVQGLPKVTLELVKRGHSDETIRKVLGGNFLRVLEAAEAHAQATRTSVSGGGSLRRIDK
jgi:membrane dipeptidase